MQEIGTRLRLDSPHLRNGSLYLDDEDTEDYGEDTTGVLVLWSDTGDAKEIWITEYIRPDATYSVYKRVE